MRRLTRFKICCIGSVEEARLAVAYGASAVGLVSTMPSGPGVIPEERIREIARTVPPGVDTFLLTALQALDAIVAQQRYCGANTLQLVDHLLEGTYDDLHRQLPGIRIVQVIHVRDEGAIDEARRVAPHVDALLLDSGDPTARVKELGGTGRVHDWSISARVVEAVECPVFLAGGLRPDNAVEAIRAVRPYALDVCSGVRTAGRLNEAKLAAFARAVRGAGEEEDHGWRGCHP